MHLIELIDNNTCIAFAAEEEIVGGNIMTIRIGAVKFNGWITSDGEIKDSVNVYDSFCVEVCSGHDYCKSEKKDNNDKKTNKSKDGFLRMLEFKEYLGDGIAVAYDVEATIGFFALLKENYGISFQNRVLGIADIARANYRDKIKDYSFGFLANRFCSGSKHEGVLEKAQTTAKIFGQLALEDDFAHCGY